MSRTKTKRYLVLLAAVGLVAAALGGTGTFASFNAETTNTGNYFATGTLLLHNNGGTTTCTSEADSNNTNNLSTNGCDVLFKVAPLNDSAAHWAHLTLSNAGSIDATDIKFDAPTGCSTPSSSFGPNALTTALTSGNAVSTLHFSALTGSIAAGDPILVTEAGHAQTFTAAAAAIAGATSVAVQTVNANFSYTTAATIGTSPTFGSGNLCSGLQFMIVETNASFNGDSPVGAVSCSYGVGDTAPTTPYTGCAFDPSKTLFNLPSGTMQPLLNPDNSTPTTLAAGASRYFLIGIKPSSSFGNTYQNRRAQFDLHWKIDQA
jgi:predicted ribosomally synthesized peptide with SipW-like signal peptide